jgi:hypothetical protein
MLRRRPGRGTSIPETLRAGASDQAVSKALSAAPRSTPERLATSPRVAVISGDAMSMITVPAVLLGALLGAGQLLS